MSGKAQHVQIQQKGRLPSDERKAPSAPVREKEGSAGKKKEKKKDEPGGKGAARETPHSCLHKRGLLCTCEKRGTVRVKEIRNKTHSTCIALKIVAALLVGGEEWEKCSQSHE